VSYLQSERHLQLSLHVLEHHAVVAAQPLLQLHGPAGLLFLPGAAQVADDALELVRQRQLRLLLDLKALLRSLTLDARRALDSKRYAESEGGNTYLWRSKKIHEL